MRNKTPPVCQKHQPAPTLDPATNFPTIQAWVNFVNPTLAPGEIWSIHTTLQLLSPALDYQGNPTDQAGRSWFISLLFQPGYAAWRAAVIIENPATFPFARTVGDRDTQQPFPPYTGLWLADQAFNCENATWQFQA